uniref:Uncharacterized protein n=1 Tax=Euplotes harpa TaxID=151035 RepID=A0A7S3J729_9SPIT|mmetsp:Transcript_23632/g.27141  ORF Transcript_23632/g.27141 Transcript_23632/m.27141 type:complete len:137 (+) Transcript_23632:540-950(+)
MTKLLIEKLLNNEKRSGIINVGSEPAHFIYKNCPIYSATKAYITKFSECLGADYSEKIDVLTASVGSTKTRLNPAVEVLSSTPESVAKHTLDCLGWDSHTFGDSKHGVRNYYLKRPIEGAVIRYVDAKRHQALPQE